MRITGAYRSSAFGDEEVRAFIPFSLPPRDPDLVLSRELLVLHDGAMEAVSRLNLAGAMVPSADWFLYGFVRKEAVLSSQIEGTEATLRDVVTFEAISESDRPDDVREVSDFVNAMAYARKEMIRSRGLPLSTRLLCEAHKRLMRGPRGKGKQPGEIRRSQNWVGGTRPGNARFVPPPPDAVAGCMAELDRWMHADDPLPPLVRAGLAHVQFETIHPFLDGNGRIGRLLITLLIEHWKLMDAPLLYLSVAIKRRQQEYYQSLRAVRTEGDWESWTAFYLSCVREAANDGVDVARRLHTVLFEDRQKLLDGPGASVPAIRLLDRMPRSPVVTLARVTTMLRTTKPTAAKAIEALVDAGFIRELTGRKRDRAYVYQRYLDVLAGDSTA